MLVFMLFEKACDTVFVMRGYGYDFSQPTDRNFTLMNRNARPADIQNGGFGLARDAVDLEIAAAACAFCVEFVSEDLHRFGSAHVNNPLILLLWLFLRKNTIT